MAAWFTNHAEPEGALDAGRSCAAEAGRLRLPLVEGLGFVLQAVAHALLDQRAEMEAAIDKAVAVSGGHPEVRGVALLMARALLWVVREDRARALGELDAGMELLRGTPVTAPSRGLWALVHALDGGDGEAAVAEVEASGLTMYWLIRGWVGHARAVTLGRQGRAAEAEEAFARADADLAPCDWFRHHARRLVAEAALVDGWGDPDAMAGRRAGLLRSVRAARGGLGVPIAAPPGRCAGAAAPPAGPGPAGADGDRGGDPEGGGGAGIPRRGPLHQRDRGPPLSVSRRPSSATSPTWPPRWASRADPSWSPTRPVTMWGRDDLKMGVCPMPGAGTTPIMATPIRWR